MTARLIRSNLLPAGMVLKDKVSMVAGEPNGAGGFVTTLDGLGRDLMRDVRTPSLMR